MFEKTHQTKKLLYGEIRTNSLYRNVFDYQRCLTFQNNEDLIYTFYVHGSVRHKSILSL